MVEYIISDFGSVRGGGNIKGDVPATSDFLCENCTVTVGTGGFVLTPLNEPVTVGSVTLTSNKSVLSYYDSESATLSATVLDDEDNVAVGQTVEFFKGSTSLGTATTNSSGVATKSYASTGSGDVSFTATCDEVTATAITVEDCIKVGFNGWTGTFTTGTDTYDYIQITGTDVSPNITLPSAWEMDYKFKAVGTDQVSSSNSGLWIIGQSTTNGVLIGHEATDKRLRIYTRSGTSNTVRVTENNVYTHQTWTDAKITYQNGTITMTVGGKTVSYSLSSAVIMQFYTSYSNLRVAEWKIKPL